MEVFEASCRLNLTSCATEAVNTPKVFCASSTGEAEKLEHK